MPRQKRERTAKPSDTVGSDEEAPRTRGNKRLAAKEAGDNERSPKKAKGNSKVVQSDESEKKSNARTRNRSTATAPEAEETAAPKRRGKSKAEDTKPAQEDSKRSKQQDAPAAKRGSKKANDSSKVMNDGAFEYTPTKSRQASPGYSQPLAVSNAGRRRTKAEDNVIPETQPEVNETIMEDDELGEPEPDLESPIKPSRAVARQSSQAPTSKRKSGNATESERTDEVPDLKRRLEDERRRYDVLESSYRDLREVGIVEANNNMNKLRNQCEAITKASNELVASLKADLETQKAVAQQTRTLQKQLKDRDAKVTGLESRADGLTGQLSSAHSEIKTLQTKLAAARNATANIESTASKAPGSTIKKNPTNRINPAANAEAAQAVQIARLKEDLYSDLTGLIIRDIKKRESDSLYDCIQTGVNGTLHFKLAVPEVSAANFQSAEFQYIPLLDENRDRDLVAILPEYLTVDITFSRQQASNFYTRVMDNLLKRPVASGE